MHSVRPIRLLKFLHCDDYYMITASVMKELIFEINFCHIVRPKKILFFPGMRVTREIFTQAAANLFFFNQFSRDILFSSLVSFAFLFLFFYVVVVCLLFLNLKIYILIHIWLCGRVSDKKIFTRPISGNKTTFFGLKFDNNDLELDS